MEVRKILVLQIWGKRGSKKEVFAIFSKMALTIWFIFLVKEGIMVLHMCGKFHVHKNSGSRDMGAKGVKNGGFRTFLEK